MLYNLDINTLVLEDSGSLESEDSMTETETLFINHSNSQMEYHSPSPKENAPLLNSKIEEIEMVDHSQHQPKRIVPPTNIVPINPMTVIVQQQGLPEKVLINKPQPKSKSYSVSNLPPATDEEIDETVKDAKKITFSSERREFVQKFCKKQSVTCAQARLFTDLFRASYEKKLLIVDDLELSDPRENIKILLDTFDFEEDKKTTHVKLLK
eukprot:gene8-4259_t